MGKGEKEFQELWGQTWKKVRAYMFCGCNDWADSDDLAQECYLRALRGWHLFNAKGSRQAWLFAIARNTRADWFRRGNRKQGLTNARPDSELHSGSQQADTDELEMVWQAVGSLNDQQGEVIHLRFAAGLNYTQISEALGIPIGTVRSRLHRGLKTLRTNLGGHENGA